MAEARVDSYVVPNTENHQQHTFCGNIFSCFKSRPRRCNSDTEACRRCSNRRPKGRSISSSLPVTGTSAGLVCTMAIPAVSEGNPSDEVVKRSRRQSEPSAPSPGLVLFNSEDHCDVVFLVGQKPDQWRFPGHSFIIAPASPVFESIISMSKRASQASASSQTRAVQSITAGNDVSVGPVNPGVQALPVESKDICQIVVSDTPPEVFENVMSFVYKNDVPFLTVASALRLLTAAVNYQLSSLGCTCLAFLSENVSEDTVLEIYPQLQRNQRRPREGDPNFPSPVADDFCTNLRNEVLLRCFDFIDDYAEAVLRQESFEKLSYESVVEIISRDTLRIRSELNVFEAVARWACQECKRRQMELVPENKREVLGKVLYLIRYLAMSPDEFHRGPVISNILEDSEKQALMSRLKGDFSIPLPGNLVGRKLDSRRPGPRSSVRCTGAVAKIPSSTKRPLGRSSSFTSGSSSSERPSRRRNGPNSPTDVKKNSTSKKIFRGLGDIVICLVQMLD